MATSDPALSSSMGSPADVDRIFQELGDERARMAQAEPGARERTIVKARELISSLETPLEAILWMMWAEPTRTFASRLALDLKLFHTLVSENGRPKSAEELAKPTGASPILVNRIARKLATMNMIMETGPDEYAPNQLTRVLTIPKYSEGIRFCYDTAGLSFMQMPEYLQKTKYANPEDPKDGPWHFAYKHPDIFGWLAEHPQILEAFHAYVHGQREDRPSWTDEGFYPVGERLVQDLVTDGSDASALVDVGGGAGHVLEDFRAKVPEWKGRLILQEQNPIIELAKAGGLHPRIEPMVHDFFSPQPIKGARAYYMRYILHDWSDEPSLQILKHLKDVMTPGYSRILINDCVVLDQGASWQHTSLDLFMMALTTSRERTEKEWYELIDRAGLKISKIWSKGVGNESLIEVVLP